MHNCGKRNKKIGRLVSLEKMVITLPTSTPLTAAFSKINYLLRELVVLEGYVDNEARVRGGDTRSYRGGEERGKLSVIGGWEPGKKPATMVESVLQETLLRKKTGAVA